MRKISLLLFALLFAVFGCATAGKQAPAAGGKKLVEQDPALRITTVEVMEILETNPDSVLIVDARPAVKFDAGHVPGAISIPKPMLPQNLDKLPKDKTIIFYCGGLACHLTPESVEIAMEAGFTDVKAWYEGMPGWKKAGNYAQITTKGMKKLVGKAGKEPLAIFDSRPLPKYAKAHLPMSQALPKAYWDKLNGLLPADKSTPLVFYCGGFKCELSHESADMALEMGYKTVSVYAAGVPDWKEQGNALWGNESSGTTAVAGGSSDGLPEAVPAEEFTKLVNSGEATVIDVRSADEFASGHIDGAINISDELFITDPAAALAKMPKEGRVLLHCATGGRAAGTYYALMEAPGGYDNMGNVQYLDANISIDSDGNFTID